MKKKIIAVFLCFVTLFSTSISVSAADTTTGLIAKYNFDESLTNEVTGTDAKVIDKTKLGASAPAADYTFSYVDGVSGKAIQFNKDFDVHGLNLNVAPKSGTTYTISVWVKSIGCNFANPIVWIGRENQYNGENWHGIWAGLMGDYQHGPCAGSNDSNRNRYAATPNVFEGLGIMKNESYDEANRATSAKLFDWTMITMVVENGSAKLYYDGQLVGRTANNELFPDLYEGRDTTVSTYLGANAWDAPFNGYADSFYMYDRALTSDDVKALFAQTHGDVPAGQFNAIKETTTIKPITGAIPDVSIPDENETKNDHETLDTSDILNSPTNSNKDTANSDNSNTTSIVTIIALLSTIVLLLSIGLITIIVILVNKKKDN